MNARSTMKLLGFLLVWGSLAGGALAAATAYLVSLDLPDRELVGLTLAAPAGRVPQPDGTAKPLAVKNQAVTPQLLAELRQAGVRDVRVRQFQLGRWRGRWWFLLAAAGLVAGAWMTRVAARPEAATGAAAGQAESPQELLATIQTTIETLQSSPEVGTLPAIVDSLGELQKSAMARFAESRPQLIAQLGLAGFAAAMDRYAAAERQIHRAWSAAVDGAPGEARTCLNEAARLLADARQRLSRPGPS